MAARRFFTSGWFSFLSGALVTILMTALLWFFAPAKLTVRARSTPATQPGPWGELIATEVPLANPNGMLPDQWERMQKPSWFFEGYSEARLIQLLRTCDLRPVQRGILFDKQFWQITSDGCTITPPEPVIWSLDARARGLIYAALANCPSNYAQCYPFRFATGTFARQLRESGLNEADIRKIRRLAYTNDGATCFTDLRIIHEVLQPSEFEELVGALYRVPAYALQVHVNPEADVEAIIRYWGKGIRDKSVAPLVKGLARVPGGGSISLGALLPPFVRSRLYTYPDAWQDANAPREDCFYTSMNFFAETPDTNFFRKEYTQSILATDYDLVNGDFTFGDRVLLVNSANRGVHMCVYVAGDFVFTKNGINRAEPWVVMKLEDVLRIYFGSQPGGRLVVYRQKESSTPPASFPALSQRSTHPTRSIALY